ncbi:1-phosphofructokinase [Aerococcaceae bacterium DSM 111020]|nr:1-phosphofructokinase [Aerococcaceae bacterium DSM 111020]
MNYTITFNPAVDLVIRVPDMNLGELNRSFEEEYVAGGKGINMAVLLKRLGQDTIATGFLGGFSGEFIKNSLTEEGIQPAFIEVEGTTRINVKLKAQQETEINAKGPIISDNQFNQLIDYLSEKLSAKDTLFLAGNAAPGLDQRHYQAIGQLAQEKKAKFVLDTNKELLTACLPFRPFLIKPNHHELGEIFGVEITDETEIIYYIKKLQDLGARNVIVSRGGEGALLMTEEGQIYTSTVPKGTLINSVGAGDSMVAGFMAAYNDTKDFEQSLLQGAASGSATAFSVGIGTKEKIEELKEQISIQSLENEEE